jgi:3-hydroxyisobutyrate dehydrogenase-like beta-hydroxyacid dehydrogenase
MMLGGDEAIFHKAQPLLEDLTSSLHYIGGPGKAAALKALVNMVMNINTAGLAEGLGLAEALGLDLKLVKEVFSQTGANSRVLETDGPDMLDREHSTFFSAAHAAKDSGIAAALGKQEGLFLPLLEASKNQFDQMVKVGLGEIDKSGISELTFKSRHADLARD